MITDDYIEKNGIKVAKVKLLNVDEEPKCCDGCDEMKICASINSIQEDVMVICKDCLLEILSHF